MRRWRWSFVLGLACAGCRVVPDDPLRPRYFTPEAPPRASATPVPPTGPALRLGWVRAAEHLGFRVVYRESAQVYRFYERRRWSESPAVFLERALRRRLYVAQGLERSLDAAAAPTLAATLLAFEEVRDADGHPSQARVAVEWVLLAGERHLGEGTAVGEEPLGESADGDTGPALAGALGRALERAVDEVGSAVAAHLPEKR